MGGGQGIAVSRLHHALQRRYQLRVAPDDRALEGRHGVVEEIEHELGAQGPFPRRPR